MSAFQDSVARFQVKFPHIPWPIGEDIELSESLIFRRYVVFTLSRYLDSRRSWWTSMELRWK